MTPQDFRRFAHAIGQDTSSWTDDELLSVIRFWTPVYEDLDELLAGILDDVAMDNRR